MSPNEGLNFFYVIAPCGYHTSNHRIPYDCSHGSFRWPDASQIKSTLLWDDNKRSLLISHASRAVCGAAVRRTLLSQWWSQRHSQAKGSLLCLSHDPVWPVRAFSLAHGDTGRSEERVNQIVKQIYQILGCTSDRSAVVYCKLGHLIHDTFIMAWMIHSQISGKSGVFFI